MITVNSSSVGLVPYYYRKIKDSDKYKIQTKKDILNTLTRYLISLGITLPSYTEGSLYNYLSKDLKVYYNKEKRKFFLQAASFYVDNNQHHEFNIKDSRKEIISLTSRLLSNSISKIS